MTEPSQYFKGRTVQEQMNEVIGYVDARAEEVAAAKADDVLAPAEAAKDAAQTAQEAAEDAQEAAESARDTTLAALPQIQQDITDLKAEDVSLDGRLDNVELRITTAEGNIVTIQGRVTAVETKNTQQDNAIAALQTADAQNVKINNLPSMAVMLTDNQDVYGNKTSHGHIINESAGYNMPSQTNRVTGDGWVKMYESIGSNHPVGIFTVLPRREANSPGFGIIACGGHHIGTVMCKWLSKNYIVASYQSSIMVTVEQDLVTIWAKNINTTDNVQMRDIGTGYNGYPPANNDGFHPSTDKTVYTMTEETGQIVGYTDGDAIDHTFITYEISS